MYESFYNFKEKPFSLQPDPAFLYLGKKHSIAYTMLEYGVLNQSPITVITGEIGSGKTTLIRHLLNQIDDNITVGLITNTHREFGELLCWVCSTFAIDHSELSKVDMYQAFVNFMIAEYANGKRTVLVVDEAQNMAAELLEELRVLSNINSDKDQLLQLILVGQPELRDTLRRPDMEQIAQRVSVDYHLDALTDEETDAYIRHRLEIAGGDSNLFEAEARRFIHHQCDGIPRLINNLCDTALVYAYASQLSHINADVVFEIVQDKIKNGGGLLVNRKRRKNIASIEAVSNELKS